MVERARSFWPGLRLPNNSTSAALVSLKRASLGKRQSYAVTQHKYLRNEQLGVPGGWQLAGFQAAEGFCWNRTESGSHRLPAPSTQQIKHLKATLQKLLCSSGRALKVTRKLSGTDPPSPSQALSNLRRRCHQPGRHRDWGGAPQLCQQ